MCLETGIRDVFYFGISCDIWTYNVSEHFVTVTVTFSFFFGDI
jgi:hypothetical protein